MKKDNLFRSVKLWSTLIELTWSTTFEVLTKEWLLVKKELVGALITGMMFAEILLNRDVGIMLPGNGVRVADVPTPAVVAGS